MFLKARKARMNVGARGKLLAKRKAELKSEMGATPYDEVADFAVNGAEKRTSLWGRLTSATTPRASR